MLKFTQRILAVLAIVALGGSLSLIAQEEELAGVWQSTGYGLWFHVEEDAVSIYQTTGDSCLTFANVGSVVYNGTTALLQDVTLAGVGAAVGATNYQISLTDGVLGFEVGKTHPVWAERAEALPAVCDDLMSESPEASFETFWRLFDENYAFFEERGVDWEQSYETYRPQVTADTSEEELFAIMREMVAVLGDGHVILYTPFDVFNNIDAPAWFTGESEEAIAEYAMQPANYLMDIPDTALDGRIVYGRLSETVGYINLLTFDGLHDEDGGHDLLVESMAAILETLQGVETIVIDVRFNPGGFDTSGLVVASYFTDERRPVFSKSVWADRAFHPLLEIAIEPVAADLFTGDVYLLTSGMTISAAETFTLAMHTLPNVTVIGEPTNGMLSDAWYFVLPNGWFGTLANERYLAADGNVYEAIGVPPDIEVRMTAEDLAAGRDLILETALQLASAE